MTYTSIDGNTDIAKATSSNIITGMVDNGINNIIDANIITAKYEGELYKNRLLNEIVYNDSITISLKDNIIYNKDLILQNQEQSYNSMKESLEIALRKEKREKTYWIIGGAIVTSALTTYIILNQ